MGRRKKTIKLTDSIIDRLQEIANSQETLGAVNKKYGKNKYIDTSDLIELETNNSYFVISFLLREIGIKGKVVKQYLQEIEELYNN